MVIRSYESKDRESILRITREAFDGVSIDQNIEKVLGPVTGFPWADRKSAALSGNIADNPKGVLVAVEGNEVVGYITVWIDHTFGTGGIANLAVTSSARGKGIGKALISAALSLFRKEGLKTARIETLEQNSVGSALYPKMGFKETARQIHYAMALTPEKD